MTSFCFRSFDLFQMLIFTRFYLIDIATQARQPRPISFGNYQNSQKHCVYIKNTVWACFTFEIIKNKPMAPLLSPIKNGPDWRVCGHLSSWQQSSKNQRNSCIEKFFTKIGWDGCACGQCLTWQKVTKT